MSPNFLLLVVMALCLASALALGVRDVFDGSPAARSAFNAPYIITKGAQCNSVIRGFKDALFEAQQATDAAEAEARLQAAMAYLHEDAVHFQGGQPMFSGKANAVDVYRQYLTLGYLDQSSETFETIAAFSPSDNTCRIHSLYPDPCAAAFADPSQPAIRDVLEFRVNDAGQIVASASAAPLIPWCGRALAAPSL